MEQVIWLNGKEVVFSRFPNQEVMLPDYSSLVATSHYLRMRYQDDRDLTHLVMVTREIQESGAEVSLTLDYMPYSRMDRRTGDYAFSLRHVAWLINSLGFKRVWVCEPHSDVTTALLDRCHPIWVSERMYMEPEVQDTCAGAYILLPDAGAAKRYGVFFGKLTPHVLVANKTRDFASGNLGEMTIPYEMAAFEGAHALIVDDLCSRGGTFIMAAGALRAKGFARVDLLVTHLEEAAFGGSLFDKIDTVFATDSMRCTETPSGSYRNLVEIPIRRFQ